MPHREWRASTSSQIKKKVKAKMTTRFINGIFLTLVLFAPVDSAPNLVRQRRIPDDTQSQGNNKGWLERLSDYGTSKVNEVAASPTFQKAEYNLKYYRSVGIKPIFTDKVNQAKKFTANLLGVPPPSPTQRLKNIWRETTSIISSPGKLAKKGNVLLARGTRYVNNNVVNFKTMTTSGFDNLKKQFNFKG
ncbi:unnamed protein product [Albugo candida]|uniref:Uncharacterized protein n=1 Tax=Albugo candida TaxID=65357 RepID=A0A024GE11_9STRA|nr:unnamed protein product [Albugo candida]|eukprot:CCI44993.1 unnamed protein product [Albugo candida]